MDAIDVALAQCRIITSVSALLITEWMVALCPVSLEKYAFAGYAERNSMDKFRLIQFFQYYNR